MESIAWRRLRHPRKWLAIAAVGIAAAAGAMAMATPAHAAGTALCNSNGPFLWVGNTGSSGQCFRGTGTYAPPAITLGFAYNATSDRVWFHQNANGSGWSACFSPGQLYSVGNNQYAHPGNVQITTNTSVCSPPSGILQDCTAVPVFLQPDPGLCSFLTHNSTTGTSGVTVYEVANHSGDRVWMHQNGNGSGWADCFTSGNVYYVAGTRDQNPGNVQVSTNTSAC